MRQLKFARRSGLLMGGVLLLCAAFVGVIALARLVGGMLPVPQGLQQLHLTDCSLPCWMGIVPGQTRFEDSVQRVMDTFPELQPDLADGFVIWGDRDEALSWRIYLFAHEDLVSEIRLLPMADRVLPFTLGDMVSLFGLSACPDQPDGLLLYSHSRAVAVVVGSPTRHDVWRQPINNISIHRLSDDFVCPV
jgi:hypothetical protein